MSQDQINKVADQISLLIDEGSLDEAKSITDKLLAVYSDEYSLWICRGKIALLEKSLQVAADAFSQAIEINPLYLNSYLLLIKVLVEKKELDQALHISDKALTIFPLNEMIIYFKAQIFYNKHEFELALAFFKKITETNPKAVEALVGLGLVYRIMGRFEEALDSFNKALEIEKNSSNLYINRGNIYQDLDFYEKAIDDYKHALDINTNSVGAMMSLATLKQKIKDYESAEYYFKLALKLDPNNSEILFNQSLLSLSLGDFKSGWSNYERRWQTSQQKNNYRTFNKPIWLGEQSIKDKTIFVFAEQGFGDTIHFSRYIKLLKNMGAKIIFEVQESLYKPIQTIDSDITVISAGNLIPDFDFYCPLLSLPLAFQTDISNIPNETPYLFSNPDSKFFWSKKLNSDNKIKIGLVWRSGIRSDNPESWYINKKRDIKLSSFSPLLELSHVEIISLQKGIEAEEELLRIMDSGWMNRGIKNFSSEIKDFNDTAAIIDNLDLVISVCTSVAHLSASMNKPTWVLIPYEHCWRWLADQRKDSPWYPSIRLFRQSKQNNWDSVIDEVVLELRKSYKL
jgi:tetratricopeptide (TPR) repeat protein